MHPPNRWRPPATLLLPLEGEVGVQITAAVVAKAVQAASDPDCGVLVLEIRSNGGSVSEMLEIAELLRRAQVGGQLRVIAFVRERAFSAAAIIALSCREVYMTPGSSIGAAVPIVSSNGGFNAVREKMASAIRAQARGPVEAAGHNGLIVDAMMDPTVALMQATDRNGRVILMRGTPAQYAGRGIIMANSARILCDSRHVLTLTADEAMEIGAAAGLVADGGDLGAALRIQDWREFGNYGRQIAAERTRLVTQVNYAYDMLVKGLNHIDDSAARLGSGDLSRWQGHLQNARGKLAQAADLAKQYPWIAARLADDLNGQTPEVVLARLDQLLRQIASARR